MPVILASYSGCRDQEYRSSKPAQEIVQEILSQKKKKKSQKKAGGVAQGVGPEFRPSAAKTKQNKNLPFSFGEDSTSLTQ
jgi:hypothetical protein